VESVKSSSRVPTVYEPIGLGASVPELTRADRTVPITLATVVPVPDKLTCCGLSVLLSVMDTFARKAPLPVGLKVTLIVQDIPTPTLELHVFV